MSLSIAERFLAETDLANFQTLHTFIRIPRLNEVDTSAIYFRIWRDHPVIRTFAPRTNAATNELESIEFNASSELVENKWGISEPAGDRAAEPEEIDVVIVPLLCFDDAGSRVGYGKGYYDRFLAKCRPDCRKIGLSLFPPVTRIDDIHDGDMPLDMCITPDEIFTFGGRTSPSN